MISIYEPDIIHYTVSAKKAIDSGWISNYGEYVKKATDKLKEILNVKHAILMNNGTCATHCLFLSLKYKYPQINKIYVSNNCYIAAWNSCLNVYSKESICVMNMDSNTWNINTDESYINSLEKNSAVFIVHNLGNIINVPRLKRLRPDLIFIEDNCEGFSGKYEGMYTGSSDSTLCSSISFYGNKIITSGEGGAFLTNDTEIFNYMSRVYSQGMSETRYLHDVHAYNYRMTNIQAAFLYDQFNDWSHIMAKKQKVFDNYRELFQPLINSGKLALFKKEENTESANWMFAVRFLSTENDIITHFKHHHIDVRPYFYPINSHKHLKEIEYSDPNSEILHRSIIMIPSSPNILYADQQRVVNCCADLCNNISYHIINNKDDKSIYLLTKFIEQPMPETFRYFKTRDISIIENHKITVLVHNNNTVFGYGHIDYDDTSNKYWLGLCIIEPYQNQKFGTKILNLILKHYMMKDINEIYLTVDVTNIHAINLYKKYGFIELENNGHIVMMKLQNILLSIAK